MKFKDSINNIFSYKPITNVDFKIPNSPNNLQKENISKTSIDPEYSKIIKHITDKYSLLINSDIVLKEFEINIKNKIFKACLLFIDGMINSESINSSVLEPLLLRNSITMTAPTETNKTKKNIRC